jgi:excinuclease UvrABC ATPase subunit
MSLFHKATKTQKRLRLSLYGVSGSGKSTLINETLYPLLSKYCYGSKANPMPYKSIRGLDHIDKVIEIDQSPIGRTPRSNPATYTGYLGRQVLWHLGL